MKIFEDVGKCMIMLEEIGNKSEEMMNEVVGFVNNTMLPMIEEGMKKFGIEVED